MSFQDLSLLKYLVCPPLTRVGFFSEQAGVVKMNVDTDMQWAYWEGIKNFYQVLPLVYCL